MQLRSLQEDVPDVAVLPLDQGKGRSAAYHAVGRRQAEEKLTAKPGSLMGSQSPLPEGLPELMQDQPDAFGVGRVEDPRVLGCSV